MAIAIEFPNSNHTPSTEQNWLKKANGVVSTPQPTVASEYEVDPVKNLAEVSNGNLPATNGEVEVKTQEVSPVDVKPVEQTNGVVPHDDAKVEDKAGAIRPPPLTTEQKAEKILNILARYRINSAAKKQQPWLGRNSVAAQLRDYISKDSTIRLVIPAFPFKSPNKVSKVLGVLPDKAEEVALMHLNGLCQSIQEVHEAGAEITIVSDGLMYSDLLGISDQEVWTYGETLRQMARDNGCDNIAFERLRTLLDFEITETLTEERYLERAPQYRDSLVERYTPAGFDVEQFIKESKDATLTYRGYIKFLEKDLEHDPRILAASNAKKEQEKIAKAMITRGKAFAAAVQQKFPDHVRLSIHASAADASKLSVSLIPQLGTCSMTPWHSSLVRAVDGSITMSHSLRVPALTHEVIYKDGQPSYFREKSDLFNWPGMDVTFDYLYPTGIIIKPTDPNSSYSLHNVHMQKVRGLAEKCSPVVLRGFEDTNDERVFKAKAYDAGEVLPWTFGIMAKVKDAGREDRMANNVTSSEPMPMHYDGMFKFVKKTLPDGTEVEESAPPRFQYFTAVTTSPPGSGYTLFANSRLFFQHLPPQYNADDLKRMTYSCKNSGFWDNHMKNLPLIVPHPAFGDSVPCVRWHEPWPMWKTKFAHCIVEMEDPHPQEVVALVDQMLYDRRVCLYLSWEKGDVVVSDNFNMQHTRTAFDGDCERELWRIHFD